MVASGCGALCAQGVFMLSSSSGSYVARMTDRREQRAWSPAQGIRFAASWLLALALVAFGLPKAIGVTWSVLVPAERGEVPDDLRGALDARPGARVTWDAYPPSVRLQALSWVYTAKRPDTRARRIATIAERAAAGERPV